MSKTDRYDISDVIYLNNKTKNWKERTVGKRREDDDDDEDCDE